MSAAPPRFLFYKVKFVLSSKGKALTKITQNHVFLLVHLLSLFPYQNETKLLPVTFTLTSPFVYPRKLQYFSLNIYLCLSLIFIFLQVCKHIQHSLMFAKKKMEIYEGDCAERREKNKIIWFMYVITGVTNIYTLHTHKCI